MCLMKQARLGGGSPPPCHPGAASPRAGGMELAPERGSRQAGRGPGCTLDPNTAGADLMKREVKKRASVI